MRRALLAREQHFALGENKNKGSCELLKSRQEIQFVCQSCSGICKSLIGLFSLSKRFNQPTVREYMNLSKTVATQSEGCLPVRPEDDVTKTTKGTRKSLDMRAVCKLNEFLNKEFENEARESA